MNNTFKNLSFIKKILAIFLIATGFFILSFIFLFGLSFISSGTYSGLGEDFSSKDSIAYDTNGLYDSFSEDYSTNKSLKSNRVIKDVDINIKTKNIMQSVESIITFSESYDAKYESSHSGDNGYGYVSIQVPADKLDKFISGLKEKYKVTSYDINAQNVEDNYEDIDSRIAFLNQEYALLEKQLENAEKSDNDTDAIIGEMQNIRQELYYIEAHKEELDNEVIYSNVFISLRDYGYTNFDTLNDMRLAIKTGGHHLIIAFIYGIYTLIYGFSMWGIIKGVKSLFKKKIVRGKEKIDEN